MTSPGNHHGEWHRRAESLPSSDPVPHALSDELPTQDPQYALLGRENIQLFSDGE